jgi:hypothetical protein
MEFRQIDSTDTLTLKEIFHLRVLCRHVEGYITCEKYPNGWSDDSDKSAIHLAVFDNDNLLAAARVNFYSDLTMHPYYPAFVSIQNLPVGNRIAYLSRVVVHPMRQRHGISKILVNMRETISLENNVHICLADVSGFQIRNFISYGYKNLGMLDTSKIPWDINPDHYLMQKTI